MLKTVLILALTLAGFISRAQDSLEFAQVYYKNAWHIIDKRGNFILNQGYRVGMYQNLCFTDNLAMSIADNKVGFTDFKGNQVIQNKFDGAHCFVFGYAPVAVGDKWGIINRKGKFIIEPVYDYAGGFGPEGLAGLLKDNRIGFVDTTGKLVIPFKYHWARLWNTTPDYPFFVNNRISVIVADNEEEIQNGKSGCLNTKGELVVPATFDFISYFEDGIATARKDGRLVLIDTVGNIVQQFPEVVQSIYLSRNHAIIHGNDGRAGLMKRTGEILLEPKYNGIDPFSEGFAAVQIESDEVGVKSAFIDTTGRFVFDRIFGFIRPFSEGYAAVEINGKWGFIDRKGKQVIEAKYDDVKDFSDGLAIVGVKSGESFRYGYIDTTGSIVIKPAYADAGYFEYGLAPVKIGKKYGFIDRTGQVIIQPKYDNAFSFQRERLGNFD
ncbi:WG repeat-containing protein [Fulvivirgaceae bacterium PWU4]|uniref:WG repeat-containing protein n=1 Tax=Chryseosolibacter histidini TaxID=2782349 RepID=A0AAP2DK18_9BACT|nr:WG repeat-containing protein [Chryseosolibacter histidini]MBT1696417.1 WG repeat-containing protein [Chryseosolibacter histidini]